MSQQLAIEFAPVRLARRTDPHTSHEAAEHVSEFAAGHHKLILDCLKEHGPLSPDQIATKIRLDKFQICRRLPEMQRHIPQLAVPTGETRLSASGRKERVWRAL